ncbi:flagellar hook-length control protein flik [hydrocarbon metagenome]|uniref:Flagellar hook-length control protein flik n=1 Tax=hydrocarbon metagenome TaxID=938273 RepID=A0A0W8FS61_9ZZZZ
MKKLFLRQIIVIFLMLTFILLPGYGQAGSRSHDREEYVLDSSAPSRTFPIMRPDDLTIRKWQDRYERAPRARIDERYHRRVHPRVVAKTDNTGIVSSTNLLDLLTYSPSESQGSCGDCWAWAGTRVMGIDLNTQQAKAANLSVQFINSCYGENACCGGWLSDVVDFYNSKLMAIPKSNTNAYFQDDDFQCSSRGNLSSVSCSSISTTTNYPLSSMSIATITTTGVAQATAISNIKNILNQGKAIWFAFYLPNSTAWNNFYNFWNNQSESAIWNPDNYCGQKWGSSGGGHAVTLVGYDDSDADTANHYWLLVNSWGTTANRPNGIFRVKMYANYGCTFSRLSAYALGFQTLDIAWGDGGGASSDTIAPTVTSFSIPSSSTSLTVSINTLTATDNVDVTGYMVTNSSTKPTASASGWSSSAPISYTFSSSTTSGTKTLYAWAKDAADNVSASLSASITLSLAGTPDLVISALSNQAKTITAYARSFSIRDTTKNQGTGSATASTTRYYLSTTTSKTSGSVLLSGTRSVPALAVGKTSSGSVTVRVPSGINRTTYYAIACADDNAVVSESNESNNCKTSSSRITVRY